MFNMDPKGVGLQINQHEGFSWPRQHEEIIYLTVLRKVKTFSRMKVVASASGRHWKMEGTKLPVIHVKMTKNRVFKMPWFSER